MSRWRRCFEHRLKSFVDLSCCSLFLCRRGHSVWSALIRGGLRFNSYVRQELSRPRVDYTPFVSLIAPFRGLDQGLRENFLALVNQDYPAYELIFVTGRADDPALTIVEEVRARVGISGCVAARLVVSGEATDSGQKVHNLMAAVRDLDRQTRVIAFVDSDARPHEQWLRSLVAPLHDQDLGAASSYRWFVPLGFNPAGHLRAVWNASIASALGTKRAQEFLLGRRDGYSPGNFRGAPRKRALARFRVGRFHAYPSASRCRSADSFCAALPDGFI